PAGAVGVLRRQQRVGLENGLRTFVCGAVVSRHGGGLCPHRRAPGGDIQARIQAGMLARPPPTGWRTEAIVLLSKRSITRRWPSAQTRFIPHAPSRKQSGCSPTQALSAIGPSTASITSRNVMVSAERASS